MILFLSWEVTRSYTKETLHNLGVREDLSEEVAFIQMSEECMGFQHTATRWRQRSTKCENLERRRTIKCSECLKIAT